MTAEQFYNHCLNAMGYTPNNNPLMRELFITNLNNVLAECYEIENVQREMKNMPLLIEPQFVGGFSDDLMYDYQLLITLIMYGVCARLAIGDEDSVAAGYYDNLYEVAKMRPKKAMYVAVDDVYGGGEDG